MFTQLIRGQRLFKWRKGLTHLMVSMKWTQQDIFFKSLSDNVKNFDLDEEKNKVLISESRIWKFDKEEPNILKVKDSIEGPERRINLLERLRKTTNMNPQQLQLVNYLKGPCPISKDKFNDLKEMCQKGIIPKTYHDFFLTLTYV